jgi:hypothetical protein
MSWSALHALLNAISPSVGPTDSECFDSLINDVRNHEELFFHHPTFWGCAIFASFRFQWLQRSSSILGLPILNDAFSECVRTITWNTVEPTTHFQYLLQLQFSDGGESDRMDIEGGFRRGIDVTHKHLFWVLHDLSDDCAIFPVGAWKFLRKLLRHLSPDELYKLCARFDHEQCNTWKEQLVSVCFRACSAIQVIPQHGSHTLECTLDIFETAVSVLYLFRGTMNISFDPIVSKFILNYQRNKYMKPVLIATEPLYAYEGNYLISFLP